VSATASSVGDWLGVSTWRSDAVQSPQRAQKKKIGVGHWCGKWHAWRSRSADRSQKGSIFEVGVGQAGLSASSWKMTGPHPAYEFVSFLYTIHRLLTGMQKFSARARK